MSEALKRPSHATDDWSRSSFFDVDSEMLKDLAFHDSEAEAEFEKIDTDNDDEEEEEDSDLEQGQFDDAEDDIGDKEEVENKKSKKIISNPAMIEIIASMKDRFARLVETGQLPKTFMDKMKNNPDEIQSFIRENREMAENELTDKLDPDSRPSPQQMIELGYLPNGSYGYYQLQNMEADESMNSPSFTNSDSSETEIDPLDGEKYNKSKQYIKESQQNEAKMEESDDENFKILEQNQEELNNLNDLLTVKNEKIKALVEENEALKKEKMSDDNKGEKIKELLIENDKLREEKDKLKFDLEQYTISHIDKEVKNENGTLLKEIRRENEELKEKCIEKDNALKEMERSKLELLKIFNCEMDRMRAEIKKLNALQSTKDSER